MTIILYNVFLISLLYVNNTYYDAFLTLTTKWSLCFLKGTAYCNFHHTYHNTMGERVFIAMYVLLLLLLLLFILISICITCYYDDCCCYYSRPTGGARFLFLLPPNEIVSGIRALCSRLMKERMAIM